MFEVGFSELLVIFVLALIVLGPEKLPRLAAQVGRWIGRARAMAKQFRDQLEEEVNVAETNKWKPTPTPEPTPSAEPPSATHAETAASASAEQSAAPPSAGTAPPDMHGASGSSSADPHTHEMHSAAPNGAHNSGPPPEPEASVYEPPAYSSSAPPHSTVSPATPNGAPAAEPQAHSSPRPTPSAASPAPPANGAPTPSQPHATSDDPPLRPGDVVTTTHERGL